METSRSKQIPGGLRTTANIVTFVVAVVAVLGYYWFGGVEFGMISWLLLAIGLGLAASLAYYRYRGE
jgi:hypothetical protein